MILLKTGKHTLYILTWTTHTNTIVRD